MEDPIQQFLAGKRFAVAGASQDRAKYGNKVLRAYQQNGYEVIPINPSASEVEGLPAANSLSEIEGEIDGLSIVTPPRITEQVVETALNLGIKQLWMQPGAESDSAIRMAEEAGANVIAGGPCLLVALRYHE